MPMFSQTFSVIIYSGIRAPVYVREVLDGLNSIGKSFCFPLMSTVQLPGPKRYDTKMFVHTGTRTSNVGLAR